MSDALCTCGHLNDTHVCEYRICRHAITCGCATFQMDWVGTLTIKEAKAHRAGEIFGLQMAADIAEAIECDPESERGAWIIRQVIEGKISDVKAEVASAGRGDSVETNPQSGV